MFTPSWTACFAWAAMALEKREIEQEGSTEKISIGTVVSDCYSMAKIYSREYQAGGIIGVINHGTVERCYFSGNVRAMKGRAGGIFSMVDADGAVFVKNNVCLASGIFCRFRAIHPTMMASPYPPRTSGIRRIR